MSWQMAVVGALGAAQYQQQGAIGKYNQSIQERNAQVAEQQAEQIDKQKEFDIAQFDKEFVKLEGSQRVASAKAGIGFSGTALRIQRANAEEAQLQREIIEYNSKVAKSQALERANMFRVQGQMARQQARMAQLQTITSTGTSLLTMSNGSPFGTKPQSDIYSQANLSFAGSRG
jgi:roadblock/LC7 domain-containing protein